MSHWTIFEPNRPFEMSFRTISHTRGPDVLHNIYRKCQRYVIESSLQEAKSDLGMADFQAVKYRAWGHHLALTLGASWFISQTRLDWAKIMVSMFYPIYQ